MLIWSVYFAELLFIEYKIFAWFFFLNLNIIITAGASSMFRVDNQLHVERNTIRLLQILFTDQNNTGQMLHTELNSTHR